MQILLVIIEKTERGYVARSPNLLGFSVEAETREQVEQLILDALDKRVAELSQQYDTAVSVSRAPVEESVPCVAKTTWGWGTSGKCQQKVLRDGLCWQHWKIAYGHATGTKINLDGCPLCGETDQGVLAQWDAPCPVKSENPNWKTLLEERKKAKLAEKRKENPTLTRHEKYLRCTATLKNKTQCTSPAERDGLCERHWELIKGHRFTGDFLQGRVCKLCGHHEQPGEWMHSYTYCSVNASKYHEQTGST